ncbi:MAG: hypothetical protein A2X86_13770 [Bdellovibrionales bacterium GWA2_49_15]|nr:MAG: hypothetical protein A2X86_13770 [Bdellovibrionales bacterium GWA2_49_15]HAZ13595.1 hypothetical protein [Bdellovibrionales bacterium]
METAANFKNRQNAEAIDHALKLLYKEKLISSSDIEGITAREHVKNQPFIPTMVEKMSDVVENIQKTSLESLSKAKDKVLTTTAETAKRVDQTAHKSPWIFVGVASALSGVAGFFLGQRFKR